MNNKQHILKLARRLGVIQARDVEAVGISRNYLYTMRKEGLLKRIDTGLYSLPDGDVTENTNLLTVSKLLPKAVIGLVSALTFHGLSSQIPHQISVVLPRGSWTRKIKNPPVKVHYVSGKAYSFGIEEHRLDGIKVNIYSPAKTVADCFKFRNKVGLDVAIEALREVLRQRKATMEELVEAARVNRVLRIMRPYLEAVV